MNKKNLKSIFATMFFAAAILASSTLSTAKANASLTAKTEVTLTSRFNGGNFSTASYSFKHSSQDLEITENNMEILFEGRNDSADYFSVSMAVDDTSIIYDLGKTSCKEAKASDVSKLIPALTALVKTGHCYLTANNDSSGRIITMFHVAEHKKSFSVMINEIEVLE